MQSHGSVLVSRRRALRVRPTQEERLTGIGITVGAMPVIREDHRICTAVAPEAVVTVRKWGHQPQLRLVLENKFRPIQPETGSATVVAPPPEPWPKLFRICNMKWLICSMIGLASAVDGRQ